MFLIKFWFSEQIVGTHTAAVRCVAYCPEVHCLLSGSWDSTVKWWDPRISTNSNALTSMMQPERVYTMTLAGTKLIVGTANRKVWVWDMRQPNRPEQQRDSSLKFQTRCIRAFLPSREGFVLSSIEGKVEFFFFLFSISSKVFFHVFISQGLFL